MELLLAFLLIAVILGMLSTSLDWRHYAALCGTAAVLAFFYQVSYGAW